MAEENIQAPHPSVSALIKDAEANLGELSQLPVTEHVRRFEALHGRLQDALASIDGV